MIIVLLMVLNKNIKPTICLNMIVKNESHIIENTLKNLIEKIKFDYWVICDTGSTDNTPELIKTFFETHKINGELFYDEWVDFAHNRTLALERAYKKTDLLLIFDADDEIIGDIEIPTKILFDSYNLKMIATNGVTSYVRVLLINNHKKFEFKSVIHEYIYCKETPNKITILQGNYNVKSGRSGNRSLDPDKYLKDALILEKAYNKALMDKDRALFQRYAFYCANSYNDYGKYEDALKWYDITLKHEYQWKQEKYIACLYGFNCCFKVKDFERGFPYLVKGFFYDEERVETLYPLLVYYYKEQMYKIAYNYYLNVKPFFETKYLNSNMTDKLFLEIDKYDFYVPYYMVLVSHKIGDFNCGINMYKIIFTKKYPITQEKIIESLLLNLQYFLPNLPETDKKSFTHLTNDYLRFISQQNINVQSFQFLNTPTYKNEGIHISV